MRKPRVVPHACATANPHPLFALRLPALLSQVLMIVWVMSMRALVMPQVTDEAVAKQAASRQDAASGAAPGGKQQAAQQQKGRAGSKKKQ